MNLPLAVTGLIIIIGGIWIVVNFLRQFFELMLRLSLLLATGGVVTTGYYVYPQLSAVLTQVERMQTLLPPNLVERTVIDEYIIPDSTISALARDKTTTSIDSLPPATPPRQIREFTHKFPQRGGEADSIAPVTSSVGEFDCEQPFEPERWIVAESFFHNLTNIQQREITLSEAGFLNVNYIYSECYDTDIGRSKGQTDLYALTIGPTWATESAAEDFAQRIRDAAVELGFELKTTRLVYLGTPNNQE